MGIMITESHLYIASEVYTNVMKSTGSKREALKALKASLITYEQNKNTNIHSINYSEKWYNYCSGLIFLFISLMTSFVVFVLLRQ
jgi:hypothetical protein